MSIHSGNYFASFQTNVKLEDAGSYQCTASSAQHSSSSIGVIVVRDHYRFNTTISPETMDVEIGGTAKYICRIYPLPPLGGNVQVSYTWTRKDNRPMSINAVGVNSNTLTLVMLMIKDVNIICLIIY